MLWCSKPRLTRRPAVPGNAGVRPDNVRFLPGVEMTQPSTVIPRGADRRPKAVILRGADRCSRLNPQLPGLAELSGLHIHGFRDCEANDRNGPTRRLTLVILRGAGRRPKAVILRGADRRSRLNPQFPGLAELSGLHIHGFRDCAPNDGHRASRRAMDSATARPMTVMGLQGASLWSFCAER